jgi:hypothetical protein
MTQAPAGRAVAETEATRSLLVTMGVTTWSTLQDIRVVMRIVRIVTVGVTMWSTLLRATLAVMLLSRVSS